MSKKNKSAGHPNFRWFGHPWFGLLRPLALLAMELAPQIFAILVFASGFVLLLSTVTPSIAPRLHILAQSVPLLVIELSHFLASLTGVLLLAVAAALWRRQEGGYLATLILLGLGAIFALFKGLDIEEAAILTSVALVLLPCRRLFNRKSRLLSAPLSASWLLAILAVAISLAWLGFFAFRDVAYKDELWWTFLRDADASRFLRASAGIAVLTITIAIATLLAPPSGTHISGKDKEALAHALAIIGQDESGCADSFLALVADKYLLFSPSGRSFIMYGIRHNHWIAMGEPVGPRQERRTLMWAFVAHADEMGARPSFYSVRPETLADLADIGLVAQKIGEAAIVPLAEFDMVGSARAYLRQVVSRFGRDGATFDIIPVGGAAQFSDELAAISDFWLSKHVGSEKSFSLGRFDLDYLSHMPLGVVKLGGKIIAFANIWTCQDKAEASIDLMRYGADAPKNVMDFLFIQLILWAKDQGYGHFNLGMAPLAGLERHRLAPILSRIGAAIFEEGEALYGFVGLRTYKQKFLPQWRPLYLACRPEAHMGLALIDVGLLTAGGLRGMMFKR